MEQLEQWKKRGSLLIRFILLAITGIFTAFPFFWMIVSALKTKSEIMDTAVFFPKEAQWGNFISIFTDSPLLHYIGNSLFVSFVTLVLQLLLGALIAYAIVFMKFKGRNVSTCFRKRYFRYG